MQTLCHIAQTRQLIKSWRKQGKTIALVTTMGNLHQGHIDLIKAAKKHADKIVASIFVNPLQFDKLEDLEKYPRTLGEDAALLSENDVDLLFTPKVLEIYPHDQNLQAKVILPAVVKSDFAEAKRQGHFTGVATVLCKLFNIVQPDTVIFGLKDYQQYLIVKQMCVDLCFPIDVIGHPTKREKTGLAMSSRNQRLNDSSLKIAPLFYQTLEKMVTLITKGETDFTKVIAHATQSLNANGFNTDYLTICDATTLLAPTSKKANLIILGAVYLGKIRLIDNIFFTLASI